ncbi:MAG: ABC transporter ATP-binding protein [Chloroflexi bacterium]|nr:ABC transporter ATP-binding protein [Chloroflexota bacterium]
MRIKAEGVSKLYETAGKRRQVVAVDGIDLEVDEGEFVALVGPSGCGKSTFLYMVGGFIHPSSGRILVDGRAVTAPGTDRGIVFQEFALFPWKTVLDNVMYGLQEKGLRRKEAEATARKYLEMTNLRGFERVYPKELSGGMKQRVAIARTLAYDPKVLLMDEPFGALDAQTRVIMQDELLRVWQGTQKTVLFVTHSVEEAIHLADRVVIFTARPGRIKEIVPVDLPRPRSREMELFDRRYAELTSRIWRAVEEEVKKSMELRAATGVAP